MFSIQYYFSHPSQFFVSLLRKCYFMFSDRVYLKWMYYLKKGKKLNLDNPQKFTEKLQWLKLYDRNPRYTDLVDKITVKNIVSNILGSEVIIPTIKIWNSVDEIDLNELPNSFVLKTNHSGGDTGVVICKDKSKFDFDMAKKKLKKSMSMNTYSFTKEWPYKNVIPQIFAEKYISTTSAEGLVDFKFLCFNGKVKVLYLSEGKNTNNITHSFYDREWNRLPFSYESKFNENNHVRPSTLEKMIEYAEKLAVGKRFVRIDFYTLNQEIYFGEITFYPTSGFGKFSPDFWDLKLGQMLIL